MDTVTHQTDAASADQPWRRPGAARYAVRRLRGIARPPIEVYEPAAGSIVSEHDVEITLRDGTILRANVYRPVGDGPCPVLVCTHPYGKDKLPKKRFGGYSYSFQYRALRQSGPIRFSTLTSWEAPDPAWWTAQGYVVVNCDLRGAGTSDGVGDLLSIQEGEDVYDVVEWSAAQRWSTGTVGMIGVSYLAISQWEGAAQRPPHLRAIVPWEGMTDPYRDLLRPGGIRETGFVRLWSAGLKANRVTYSLSDRSAEHPVRDDYWRSVAAEVSRIEVPVLVCTSFSDNNLHSRGSFRAFQQIASTDKHAYTHRSGKWATFYGDEARRTQLAFFDRHLRGADTPGLPPVRLEVRESREVITAVRAETTWPLASTQWTALHLTSDGLSPEPAAAHDSFSFDTRTGGARFGWTVAADTEITGPMSLRLFLEMAGSDDVDLYAGVEKWRGTEYVPFEGSYGFGRDRVATGGCGRRCALWTNTPPSRMTPCPPTPRGSPCARGRSPRSTFPSVRQPPCSAPASSCASSSPAAGCGRATR